MKFIIGDEVGQAKVISTTHGLDTTLPTSPRPITTTYFPPSRTRPISHLLPNITYRDIATPLTAILSTGGHLRIFDPTSSPSSPAVKFSHTISCPPESAAVSLSVSSCHTVLTAAVETGDVVYVNLKTGDVTSAKFDGVWEALSIVAPSPAVDEKAGLPEAVVIAPKEGGLELWSADGKTNIWKSKNPKQSAIKLEVMVKATAVEFLGPAVVDMNGKKSWRFVVGSRDGLVRIFDTKAARRAVWSQQVAEKEGCALNALRVLPRDGDEMEMDSEDEKLLEGSGAAPEKASLARELKLAVADMNGLTQVYDCRRRLRAGVLKGVEGVIKGLTVERVEESGVTLIAGVGHGRYLCVWDQERRLVSRVFVKSTGVCVGVLEAEDEKIEVEEEVDPEVVEEEQMWEGMEEVVEEGGAAEGDKKRRRIPEKAAEKEEGEKPRKKARDE